jgi:NHL repeat
VKHLFIAGLVAVSSTVLAQPQASVPEIPYDANPAFLKLPPDIHFGEASGVAVNSKGHVFVFSRGNVTGPAYAATASQLLEFDQTGKFVREMGRNVYAWSYAHTVRVDRSDNVWAVDKGSDMVVRFNPEGRVDMVFGRKKEASDEAEPWTRVNPPRPPIPGQFRQPTDVAWDAEGNIYISDGYINSRVAKFDKNGDCFTSIGEPGSGKLGNLNTPHSIANDAKGNIYVADRGNRRIQVIDPKTNTFVREIKIDVAQAPVPADAKPWMGAMPNYQQALSAEAPPGSGTMAPGSPWAICVSGGPTQYIYSADAFPGRIYKLTLDGKLVGMLGKTGRQPKQFGWIHEIACPSENELYVAEILNWRVQKLTLRPQQAKSTTAGE